MAGQGHREHVVMALECGQDELPGPPGVDEPVEDTIGGPDPPR